MDPDTLRELVEILGNTTGEAIGLLWALVILEYISTIAEGIAVAVLFYGFYRLLKFLWENRKEIL